MNLTKAGSADTPGGDDDGPMIGNRGRDQGEGDHPLPQPRSSPSPSPSPSSSRQKTRGGLDLLRGRGHNQVREAQASNNELGSSEDVGQGSDSSDDEAFLREAAAAEPELYDPSLDDRDQAWVDRIRGGRKSDAVLSCPACLTTVCLDCQRHEVYINQYRAMFVRNCVISRTEVIRMPLQTAKRKKKKKNARGATRRRGQMGEVVDRTSTGGRDDGGGCNATVDEDDKEEEEEKEKEEDNHVPEGDCETFWPVKCRECGTQVAVIDKDEVFHFFDVIPSYS